MYYTGLDPRTMKPVYVPKDPYEKAMQRALIQYRNPKNYSLVRSALEKAGRTDLIGNGKECLIRLPSLPKKPAAAPAKKPAAAPSKKSSAKKPSPSVRSAPKPSASRQKPKGDAHGKQTRKVKK